jgi:hypothetical protein
MSFRSRLFLAFLLLLLVPLGVLAIGVRREMERRVTTEYRERVRSLAELVRLDLAREGEQITRRLAALRRELASDNRFRTAAVQEDPAMRAWQLDWAGDARGPTGLDYLWLQDSAGRVLSSGHFRNEFDRVEKSFRAIAAGQHGTKRARTESILTILEDKRQAAMSRTEAGYFIRDWQEISDQVRQMIAGDPRYPARNVAQTKV